MGCLTKEGMFPSVLTSQRTIFDNFINILLALAVKETMTSKKTILVFN